MTTTASKSPQRQLLETVAWISLVSSFPVWCAAFGVVPFLPIDASTRVAIAGGCIAAGEVMFWGAGLVLGTSVMARFRAPKVTTGSSYAGKRVVVVGAAGGLGSSIVQALVREGAEVVALVRDVRTVEAGPHIHVEAIDLGDATSIDAAAARCGVVDHVVCAAGVDIRKPLLAHSVDEIDRELAVDLRGPLLLTRAFLPLVRNGGSLALVGGFADGRLALPYYAADVAARAGLSAFVESMNRELTLEGAPQRLTFVCPAPADTSAERPYAALWSKMGTPLVAPPVVANFVLQAVLQRKNRAVMGWSTRALASLNAVSPTVADLLRFGPLLRDAFSSERGQG